MFEYNYCPVCAKDLKENYIEGHLRKHCTHCNFVHYINPKPAVAIVAFKDKKLLTIKRGVEPGKGLWSLPSGFIDCGESSEEACLRELKEETAMTGDIKQLLGVYSEEANIYGPVMIVIYLVENLKGEPLASDDAADVKFISLDKVEDLNFSCFNKAFRKAISIIQGD
ncbi:NUDIX hydrolase [Natronospora cellulosivora (SeqCode)]